MGFNEFKELFGVLNVWKQNFMMFDQDRSGTVEPHEMSQAVLSMGYRISAQTLNGILKRYSKNGRIFFDDYVACCVKLRALTGMVDLFQKIICIITYFNEMKMHAIKLPKMQKKR
ncbi:Grancalcin [Acipenser ruthenus]|uniref:Grancalcin n=1 Tax=Acipenser ruthenus TaxID=7906 RepID=A0A444U1A7_ACIRT|nr:Grancalcin [Acipenser ruthenus]